jgi:hypothetical protein
MNKTKNLPIENSGEKRNVWGKNSFYCGNCETLEFKNGNSILV